MRISYRNGSKNHTFSLDLNLYIFSALGFAHVDRYLTYFPANGVKRKRFDSRKRLYFKVSFIGITFIVNVFAHAADSVTAHFRFASVCIENAHFKIRRRGRRNINHTVRPRSEMSFGKSYGKFFYVFGDFAENV